MIANRQLSGELEPQRLLVSLAYLLVARSPAEAPAALEESFPLRRRQAKKLRLREREPIDVLSRNHIQVGHRLKQVEARLQRAVTAAAAKLRHLQKCTVQGVGPRAVRRNDDWKIERIC